MEHQARPAFRPALRVFLLVVGLFLGQAAPTHALSFTESFDGAALPAGWTLGTGHVYVAGTGGTSRIRMNGANRTSTDYYDLYTQIGAGIYTMDIRTAQFSAQFRRNAAASATSTLWWYARMLDGKTAYSAAINFTGLGTAFGTYTTTLVSDGAGWNASAGFDFAQVAYVGLMYNNPSSLSGSRHHFDMFTFTGFKHTPEPSTLVLAWLAAGLWYQRRRRPSPVPARDPPG